MGNPRLSRKWSRLLIIVLLAISLIALAIPQVQGAEGDYTGDHWDTSAQVTDNYGITTDGSNIWVMSYTDKEAYKYTMAGVYVDSFDTSSQTASAYGIETDGVYIWVLAITPDHEVYKYHMNGTYTGEHWDHTSQGTFMRGICTDGSNIWLVDTYATVEEVFKYEMNGDYTTQHWDTGIADDPTGMTTDGSNIWISDNIDSAVHKFTMEGSYVSSFDTSGEVINEYGVTIDRWNTGFIWVLDLTGKEVYKYWGPTPPTGVENKAVDPSDSTVDDEQWFFLNASIEVLQNTSTFLFNRIDLDPDGLNLSCSYTNATDTFVEESDPNNYLELDVVISVKTDLNSTFVRVDYYLRIHPNVTKDGLYNVTVYSTASGDLDDTDTFTSVFYLTIRTPTDPTKLFGAGFNASSPYVELHWTHDLLIFDLFEVQNSSNDVDWTYLGQNTTAQYTDSQVVNGTERYYKVRACRDTGVGWKNSSFSKMSNFETVYFVEAAEAPAEVNIPQVDEIEFNTTVDGEVCGVSGEFSDVEGLSGYIFWENATSPPGGANSSFTSLTGTSDSALENITLPSSGTKLGVKYYVNDTDGNWAVDTLVIFPTAAIDIPQVNYPGIDGIEFNTTIAGEVSGVIGEFSDIEGLSGYIFWSNVTNPPVGVNSSFTALAGTSDSTLENITLPSADTKVGVKYFVNDTDGNWAVDTLIIFPTATYVPQANYPAVDEIEFNTTVAEDVCGVSGEFSDVEGLSGYIFWNNATSPPGGVNSSFTALAGNSDSALENVTLPSDGIKMGVIYYVNDTDGNWGVDTLVIFPSEAGVTYVTGSIGIFLMAFIILLPIIFYAVKRK